MINYNVFKGIKLLRLRQNTLYLIDDKEVDDQSYELDFEEELE